MNKLSPDEQVMLSAFSMSVSGKLIHIAYTLKCFVKHDAWNEYGEGKVVSLPVKIIQPPTTIVSQENVVAPQGWAPQMGQAV